MIYITPTLLNSWFRYLNASEEDLESAKQHFLSNLYKIPTKPTNVMYRGINFEKIVRQVSEGRAQSDNSVVNTIADIVKDGLWQATVSKSITINDFEILLYGKCDVIKENTIYDIKTTGKYKSGRYSNSIQHDIYLYCTGLPRFEYLVSDGLSLFIEEYMLNELTEFRIQERIKEFISWLDNNELLNIYLEKWKTKKSK